MSVLSFLGAGLANIATAAAFDRLRLVAVPYLGILVALIGAPEVCVEAVD